MLVIRYETNTTNIQRSDDSSFVLMPCKSAGIFHFINYNKSVFDEY